MFPEYRLMAFAVRRAKVLDWLSVQLVSNLYVITIH